MTKLEGSPLEIIRQWLENHPAPDEKRYYIGGQEMSARELCSEVEQGTQTGQDYILAIQELVARETDHCSHTVLK